MREFLSIIIVINSITICVTNNDFNPLSYTNNRIENVVNIVKQNNRIPVTTDKIFNKFLLPNDQYINESGNNNNININESGNINNDDAGGNLTIVPTTLTSSSSSLPLPDEEFENFYNQKLGLFLFTKYCGPGDRDWKNIPNHGNRRTPRSYRGIDACCKAHDGCENYIDNSSQYNKFPGLSIKSQLFAR